MALSVENIAETKKRLDQRGIVYATHEVPDRGVLQLFFFDPEGTLWNRSDLLSISCQCTKEMESRLAIFLSSQIESLQIRR